MTVVVAVLAHGDEVNEAVPCPRLARLRHGDRLSAGPLIEVHPKWRFAGKIDANDPERS